MRAVIEAESDPVPGRGKDYRDIVAILSADVSLERGPGAFARIPQGHALALRAIGYFKDGDLPSLPKSDQDVLRAARDRVTEISDVTLTYVALAGALGSDKA